MLNYEMFQSRLTEWSTRFPQSVGELTLESPSPIALYQHIFGLIHDLKSTVQISEDTEVRGLYDTVLASDAVLNRLAFGEIELDHGHNSKLYLLASQLKSLESLQVFLETSEKHSTNVSKSPHPPYPQRFPWEGLSKARAQSCFRHGYLFYLKTIEVALSELGHLDSKITNDLKAARGHLIIRQIETIVPNAAQSAELLLRTTTLVAIPKITQIDLGDWTLAKEMQAIS